MSTLALSEQHDLYFVKGRMVFVSGSNTDEEIAQRLRVRLKFLKGEWFLNTDHGIPYFEEIVGQKGVSAEIIEAIVREEIKDVQGVKDIIESFLDFNKTTRIITYVFKVYTSNNTVISEKVVVI